MIISSFVVGIFPFLFFQGADLEAVAILHVT